MPKLSAVQRYRLRTFLHWLPAAILFPMIGMSLGRGFRPAVILASIVAGTLSSAGILSTEFFLIPALRKKPVLVTALARACGYFFSLALGFAASIWVSIGRPFDAEAVTATFQVLQLRPLQQALGIAFGFTVITSFLISVARKIGPGNFVNWLLGRYHRPRIEERIFMFLDMKDSTTLAEKLGNLQFSELVADFFEDLTPAILATNAEVSHFIGDEVVLCWQVEAGLRKANCLRIFSLFAQELESRAREYRKKFGLVPGFKAGLHFGEVVSTEVGTVKSELVFHGDVLNTTARITSLCSDLGREFLVSKELADRLTLPEGLAFEPMGSRALKGKAAEVEIVAVRGSGGLSERDPRPRELHQV